MATQTQLDNIRKAVEGIRELPIDELVSNAKWGELNFESARQSLDQLFSLGGHLLHLPIQLLPDTHAQSVENAIINAATAVGELRKFTIIDGTSPAGRRDQIVQKLNDAAEALLVATQGWIGFLAYQAGDVQQNINALSKAVADAERILSSAKETTAQSAKDINDIITAAREASAGAGVGVFTSDFSGRATDLEKEATKWLRATAVFGFMTIVAALAYALLVPIAKDASNAQVVQYVTSKVLVLLVLFTATVWCGRLFKATKHQAATNNHRANALKTFQAFTKAASDDPTRDAVLLESTRSIFSVGPNGYLDAAEPAADSGSKVLEIIKSGSRG